MAKFDASTFDKYPVLLTSSGKYRTNLTRKYQNRKKWEGLNLKKIYTIIPGTIIDVLVKNGQMVKEGETLLILEAMKMQNQILMPFDGKIKRVNVKPDDKVPKNHVMIEIA